LITYSQTFELRRLEILRKAMLKSFSDAPLAVSRDGEYGGFYAYLEAWKYSNVSTKYQTTFTVIEVDV
jgi:hypothetical protein